MTDGVYFISFLLSHLNHSLFKKETDMSEFERCLLIFGVCLIVGLVLGYK